MQVQDIQVCSHELEHFDRAPGISRHVLDFDEVLPTLLVLADHPRGELEFRALETERLHSVKDVEGGAIDCAFDVGAREVQFPDLCGPWHGRQHLEGLLAVNLLAAADAEL